MFVHPLNESSQAVNKTYYAMLCYAMLCLLSKHYQTSNQFFDLISDHLDIKQAVSVLEPAYSQISPLRPQNELVQDILLVLMPHVSAFNFIPPSLASTSLLSPGVLQGSFPFKATGLLPHTFTIIRRRKIHTVELH